MSKVEAYKRADTRIPERTLVWQLSGTGFDAFHIAEIDVPKMGPEDILFRSDSNGICFSDVKIIKAGEDHPRLAGYDLANDKVVPGHEISITVMDVGPQADPRIRVGDRFIVQADMLKYTTAVGYAIWGGMIQYGCFDRRVQEYLIKVEEDIGYAQASLVEPWACIEASYERADLKAVDDIVWVIGGGGPMGQMHILRTLCLKERGQLPAMNKMLVTDVSDERMGAVRQRFGARFEAAGVKLETLNALADDFDAQMNALAPEGVAYAIGCAQIAKVLSDSLKYLRRYGVMNLFAGIKRGDGPVFLGDIHYDQHTITGNSGSRLEDMEKMLRITERGELDTNASAGAVVGMKACKEGVQAVADGSITNKTVLYPQLPDLPLTPIEKLPDLVEFSEVVAADVRAGKWSREAESEMLEQLLPGGSA